jgi:hypothetical protein
MRKIGNLFELAEKRLRQEKKLKIIPCYTESDIIEYAIEIRKFLDKAKKVTKLTATEKKRYNKILRRNKYLTNNY